MVMRTTIIAGLAVASAHADAQTIYRDSSGQIVGTSRDSTLPGTPAQRQYYDASGAPVGNITRDGFGGAYVRDSSGQLQGTITGDGE